MGVPSSAALAPDAPPLPAEWREGSGLAFALAECEAGRPADPLLFALTRHHPRMHDGRAVDAGERARLAIVLVAPRRPAPPVPMVEARPDDEAPAELELRLRRRSRVAELVPAGKVTGWVPQWKRAADAKTVPAPADQLPVNGPEISAFDRAAYLRGHPSDGSMVGPVAPATAADAPAHLPPCAGASVSPIAAAVASRHNINTAALSSGSPSDGLPVAVADARADPPRTLASAPAAGGAAGVLRAPRVRPPKPSVPRIVAAVARQFTLPPQAIFARSRENRAARARQVAWWLARRLLKRSFPKLGRSFDRDHTSIAAGVHAVEALKARDVAFAAALEALERAIRRGEDPTGPPPAVRLRKVAP